MAYCAESDIAAAVGEADLIAMSDRGNLGAINSSVVASAISEADSLIDSYASKRFAVPFAGVSVTIRTLSIRLAVRAMRRFARMTLVQDIKDEETDRKWLEDLAAGKVTPGTDPAPMKSQSYSVDKFGERDPQKVTSRSKLKGFW